MLWVRLWQATRHLSFCKLVCSISRCCYVSQPDLMNPSPPQGLTIISCDAIGRQLVVTWSPPPLILCVSTRQDWVFAAQLGLRPGLPGSPISLSINTSFSFPHRRYGSG